MYQVIGFSQFIDAFVARERQANFATHVEDGQYIGWYDGLRVLFDYLEESTDGTYELDVIALCCEFSHDTAVEIASQYGLSGDHETGEDVDEYTVRQYLERQGVLIGETEYGFVYMQH